jgi:hypothetical protein
MMKRPSLLALPAVGAALVVTGLAAAAAGVSGSIAGPVTSVKGDTFTLKSSLSPTGTATVHTTSSTTITEQVIGSRDDLKTGQCAVVIGQRGKNGSITAQRVMLSSPVKGSCQNGFFGGRGAGPRANGGPPRRQGGYGPPPGGYGRPPGNFANFGFAAGAITAVNGSTVKLHSNQRGDSTVTVSSKTQIGKTEKVDVSAIKVKECAFVRGTSSDKGVNVSAQNVSLTQPGPNGCNAGFQRRR